jgi:hypothetical protein
MGLIALRALIFYFFWGLVVGDALGARVYVVGASLGGTFAGGICGRRSGTTCG